MTAKERLRQEVDGMSEEEAERWLAQLLARGDRKKPHYLQVLEELQRDIPEDEYLRVPSSDLIDEIVYGRRSND